MDFTMNHVQKLFTLLFIALFVGGCGQKTVEPPAASNAKSSKLTSPASNTSLINVNAVRSRIAASLVRSGSGTDLTSKKSLDEQMKDRKSVV